ncbi:MAG: HAMP domain-containing histidine kinase [Crocinitomicaceae bacterium]|nr:HAMP domain-containing histidine kinase [Crocinitomicaceae bacterium]
MNIYSNKQRWKIFLLFMAMVIVGITLWYSNHIAEKIREGEHQKVELWSEAIQRRAELVKFTEQLFDNLRAEERKKADILAQVYQILSDPNDQSDLTFVAQFLPDNNPSIPVLIYDDEGKLVNSANLPDEKKEDDRYIDSLFQVMQSKYAPITFPEVGLKVYYNDSYLFMKLQSTMDDLINSFISETVINAASVPVIVTDSTQRRVLKLGNIDTSLVATPELAERKIGRMREENTPIMIELPGQGKEFIFYEDSVIIKQLQLFPVIQLILVGAFLLISYLIFSTFRKAEQNQVWVGMAKETAHQLGTPLSSLMAWTDLLAENGVDKSILAELNKDIERLNTITDRFSKIGSNADLQETNVLEIVQSSFDYLQKRVSSHVAFSVKCEDTSITAKINKPLFGWVLENLVKNAVDAMDGEGRLSARVLEEGGGAVIEVSDTGKGIAKNKWKTVFQPGFTTKKRGWGLGLSLVKRIIENYHNGKIFVKSSEMGKGTTFRIELPD